MMKAMEKVKSFLTKDKIVFGVCKRVEEKTGINAAILRVMLIIIGAFVTFLPTVIVYLAAGCMFSVSSVKGNTTEEKTEA